jgi:uncharacterized metal-binding protein
VINIKRLFCVASISYIIGIIMRLYFGSIAFLSIPIAVIILLITKNKKIIVILICLIISIGYVSILENKYSKMAKKGQRAVTHPLSLATARQLPQRGSQRISKVSRS